MISHRVGCNREKEVLRICQGHPNIVELTEVYEDATHTYIVMELLSGGELPIGSRLFTEPETRLVGKQLANAIAFMHGKGVVHRDLKPENLVFAHADKHSVLKIVDFGFARVLKGEELLTPCYTVPYAAPEVLNHGTYSKSCDLWSIGAILYIMISGRSPRWINVDETTDPPRQEVEFKDACWRNVSNTCLTVVKQLLAFDPHERLDAVGLQTHPWLDAVVLPSVKNDDDDKCENDDNDDNDNENDDDDDDEDDEIEKDNHEEENEVDADTEESPVTKKTRRIAKWCASTQRPHFPLRAVHTAKLALRRRLHKHSASRSVSTVSVESSSSSVQIVRPQSTSTNSRTPPQPCIFDFREDFVNEYLSSLSSSSNSNSPKVTVVFQNNRVKSLPEPEARDVSVTVEEPEVVEVIQDEGEKCENRSTKVRGPITPPEPRRRGPRTPPGPSPKSPIITPPELPCNEGPLTRARKRKLDQTSGSASNSDVSIGSSGSISPLCSIPDDTFRINGRSVKRPRRLHNSFK